MKTGTETVYIEMGMATLALADNEGRQTNQTSKRFAPEFHEP